MRVNDAIKMRILDLCSQREITLNKLSTISGMTQSTISNIINRPNNNTTISTIQKICDGLEIDIRDFFDSDLFENLEQEIV